MSLFVACLCHDLDHRGTNSAFLSKTGSPLAKLYCNPIIENHHFNQALTLLQIDEINIFSNYTEQEYFKVGTHHLKLILVHHDKLNCSLTLVTSYVASLTAYRMWFVLQGCEALPSLIISFLWCLELLLLWPLKTTSEKLGAYFSSCRLWLLSAKQSWHRISCSSLRTEMPW